MQHAPTWNRYAGSPADVYERHFVPTIGRRFAEALVAAVDPQPGERALDVACGTGVVARLLSDRAGRHGTVVGIDGHPGMLATARATAPEIEWRQANAEGLPFDDDTFDVALCSLGLQFFADQGRALQEMGRVVRPGGRVGVATVGPTPPAFRELRDVLSEHLGDHVAGFIDAVFGLDDPARLDELMSTAGLEQVATSRREIHPTVDPPAEFFWQYVLGTPLAEHLTNLDDGRRSALERAVVERWQRFTVDGQLVLDTGLVLGTAEAPGTS